MLVQFAHKRNLCCQRVLGSGRKVASMWLLAFFFVHFVCCCYTPFGSKNPFFKRRKISFNFVASGSRKKKESRKLSDGKKNIFQATQIKIDVMYERWKKPVKSWKLSHATHHDGSTRTSQKQNRFSLKSPFGTLSRRAEKIIFYTFRVQAKQWFVSLSETNLLARRKQISAQFSPDS